MIAGVGLFGTFTAGVAALFVRSGTEQGPTDTDLLKELRLLHEHLDELETKLAKGHVALPAQFGTPAQ